jgi:hypothetical protein
LVEAIFAFLGWFALAAVALYVASRVLKKRDKLKTEVLRRFSRAIGYTAVFGYTVLFFTYEQLPFLGMRLWFLVTFVMFCVWLVRAIVYAVRDYPRLRDSEAERRRFEKYLNKGRKK